MKNKINYLLIVIWVLSFASCNNDDSSNQKVKPSPKLSLEKSSIEIEIGTSAEINIKAGAGAYHVFSANPEIATVELNEPTLTIKALSFGETSMIISDKNNQYTTLNVKAFYTQIALEQNEIIINKRLGHQKKDTIRIVQGNLGYSAKSENEQLATATIDNDLLIVTAQAEGETKLEITDSRGFKLTVPVKIKDTTEAYTSEELDKIKADDTVRYFYNGKNLYQILDGYIRYYQHIHDSTTGFYGFDMVQYPYYFKFHLTGDKSVGKKQGVQLHVKVYKGLTFSQPKDINFEIIKNDGTKFWAVYSFIEEGVLNYGYFCDSIN